MGGSVCCCGNGVQWSSYMDSVWSESQQESDGCHDTEGTWGRIYYLVLFQWSHNQRAVMDDNYNTTVWYNYLLA